VADPVLHAGQRTHTGCAMGAGLPRTPTRPWHAETPPGELRPQCGEPGSTGIGRSRFAPALVAPVRQREVTAIVVRRNPIRPAVLTRAGLDEAWETGAESGSWARQNLPPSTSRSDSGAMQILANTDEHVDAVPRSRGARAERDFEVLVPLQPASHAGGGSPQRPKRRSARKRIHDFAGNGSCGVGIPAS
jgi:hypothetical protein